MNTEQFGFLKDGTSSIHLKGHLESDVSIGVEETLAINVIDFFILIAIKDFKNWTLLGFCNMYAKLCRVKGHPPALMGLIVNQLLSI